MKPFANFAEDKTTNLLVYEVPKSILEETEP